MRSFIRIFVFLIAQQLLMAQIPKGYNIQFLDKHYKSVTHIKMHPDGEYFFTGDESGKVLMWETQNFRFVKTLVPSKANQPIRGMELARNNQELLVSKGLQGRFMAFNSRQTEFFGTELSDSLSRLGLFNSDYSTTNLFSGDFFPCQVDSFILQSSYNRQPYELLVRSKSDPDRVKVLYTSNLGIQNAAVAPWGNYLCVVEGGVQNHQYPEASISLIDYSTKQILKRRQINARVIYLHFDKEQDALIIYLFDFEANQIKVIKSHLKQQTWEEIAQFSFLEDSPHISIQQYSDKIRLAFSSSKYPNHLLVLEQKGKSMKRLEVQPHPTEVRTINTVAFVPESDHLVCFSHSQKTPGRFESTLYVYDLESNEWIDSYSNEETYLVRGSFLPDNSVAIVSSGNFVHESGDINSACSLLKYYPKGTMKNRFGGLTLEDYFLSFHNTQINSYNQFLEEKSGKLVLVGQDISQNQSGIPTAPLQYLVYDLLKDKIEFLFPEIPVDFHPVDYRDGKKRLLLSSRSDFDGNREFQLITPRSSKTFDGKFKVGALSLGGDYLLLLDKNDLVQIHDLNNEKVVYSQTVEGSEFIVGTVDSSGFWLSSRKPPSGREEMPDQTLFFNEENGNYSFVKGDLKAVFITQSGEQFAAIFKDAGLVLGEKKALIFEQGEFPFCASFNKDGSILMVSLENGQIKLFTTSDLLLRGTMIHPDERSHVVKDNLGNFISNTNSDKQLVAEVNGTIIPIQQVENLYNQPEKVLSIFGEPDPQYKDVLARISFILKSRINNQITHSNTHSTRPRVLSVKYNGKPRLFSTKEKEIDIQIEAKDPLYDITKIRVKINGVLVEERPLHKKILKGGSQKVSERIMLANGYNELELSLLNENGMESAVIQQNILYNGKIKPSNLYLLAVGISKYQQSNFNLTFADKDAMDLAMLYGDSTVLDIDEYQKYFLGDRYVVKNTSGIAINGEIKYFDGSLYSGYSPLHQADMKGNYWIQYKSDSNYILWDFKSGQTEPFPSKVLPDFHFSNNDPYIVGMDNRSFFYKDKKDDWHVLDLENKTTKSWKMPFANLGKPISDGRWVGIINKRILDTKGDSLTQYYFSFAHNSSLQWEYTNIAFPSKYPSIAPNLIAASPKGDLLLVEQFNELSLFRFVQNQLVLYRVPSLKYVYGASYSISKENTEISWLESRLEADDTPYFMYYSVSLINNNIDSTKISGEDSNKIGLNNLNGRLQWIEQQGSIAKESNSLIDEVRQRANFKPASFDNVYVKVLTNEEATQNEIFKNLKAFLQPAGIDDQVMVFFAGHGFLDSTQQYYFAPHDTDFKQPTQKGVNYWKILEQLERTPATRKLLIMDTCHSGDVFSEGAQEASISAIDSEPSNNNRGIILNDSSNRSNEQIAEVLSTLFNNPNSTSGVTVLAASSGVDVAFESREMSNGALTNAFITEVLKKFIYVGSMSILVDGKRTIKGKLSDEFMYNLQTSVLKDTKGQQLPNFRAINKKAEISVW